MESGVRHQIEQHRPDPLPFGSPAMLIDPMTQAGLYPTSKGQALIEAKAAGG